MNKEEIFAHWAPESSIWSRWAKPVLFACLGPASAPVPPAAEPATDVSWAPPPTGQVALVLDLPGAEAVSTAVALAARGFRPVPLFNAVPLPFVGPLMIGGGVAAVNVLPIMSALRQGAEALARAQLPTDAPPAFLLDANRQGEGRKMLPGEFDNRSISFTTDFPSANFLAAYDIQRVLLVQRSRREPQTDLAHSLRRWQDGGLVLERKQVERPDPPEPFTVARPSWYGAMFQRALAVLGFRRAGRGGFGAWVPEASSGG